jgi:hypothetical protein
MVILEVALEVTVSIKRLTLAVLASLLACNAGQAFEVTGASLTFDLRSPSDDSLDQSHFTGTLELTFGAGLGLQLGVQNTVNAYFSDPAFAATGYELHLIWRPQAIEGLALGVVAGVGENFQDYTYQGIEAKYVSGAFDAEFAYVNYREEVTGIYDAENLTLEVGYRISDRFRAFAGYNSISERGGSFSPTYTFLGGSYRAFEGASIYGSYGVQDFGSGDDVEVVMLGLRYDFGAGRTFSHRSYADSLPGN